MKHFLSRLSLVLLISLSTYPAIADEDSHRKAAEKLLVAMNINQIMIDTVDKMVELEIEKNPQLLPFKSVMGEFFLRHMTGDVLIDFMSGIYMEEFSENELIDMTNFYETPTGQKAITKLPILTQKGARWGQKQVSDNIEELKGMIADEAKRLEKLKNTSPQ